MNTSLIIPVRYNSDRLKGKVLREVNGKPNLERIIDRALLSSIDNVILALSEDDCKKIMEWFEKYTTKNICTRVKVYIEDTNNLMRLTINAANHYDVDLIVDCSSCCSFIDPLMIDTLIDRLLVYKADYSTNCITRSFPDGFDVQVYTKEIYEKVAEVCWDIYNRRWTGWNIWHFREYLKPIPRIINYEADKNYYFPDWRLTLDTLEDFHIIEDLYKWFESGITKNPNHMEIINVIKNTPEFLQRIKENKTTPNKVSVI